MGMSKRSLRTEMRSYCCDAQVDELQEHSFGNKWCNTCKQPCYWRGSYIEEEVAVLRPKL